MVVIRCHALRPANLGSGDGCCRERGHGGPHHYDVAGPSGWGAQQLRLPLIWYHQVSQGGVEFPISADRTSVFKHFLPERP